MNVAMTRRYAWAPTKSAVRRGQTRRRRSEAAQRRSSDVTTPAVPPGHERAATLVERGGPGYLENLVLLLPWNAIKFAVLAVAAPFRWVSLWLRRLAYGELPRPEQAWLPAHGRH